MKLLLQGILYKVHYLDDARKYTYVIMSWRDVNSTPIPDEIIYALGGKLIEH